MRKFICIHGHFYQPPRENPWTGEVDAEESAKPFHDWNERIHKECYEANTRAKILTAAGETKETVNNFAHISFDFGPTLLSWLKKHDAAAYHAIIKADKDSVSRHGGHGNAMAQIYNHVIMPLCSRRDKITQVIWGIKDFQHHFGRKPEGMWLSETAVDRETLAILADQGILFTVLAPHQASRVRRVGFGTRWEHVPHDHIDPKHPYRIVLREGRQFHIFFYDGPVSRSIAFEGLLNSGDQFVQKLMGSFGRRERHQLVSTATDGESYGHHHKFGEMALAYAIRKIQHQRQARLTNFAEFLDRYGSDWEADVYESSSWSCSHGVERWRSDCGCRINHDPKWNQKWRSVLREAFDYLKAIIDETFERELAKVLKNPWDARNDYVDVMLDSSDRCKKKFIARHARKQPGAEDEKLLWDLMEAEKFSLFMYTSCGWFFDDISGIEPIQVMKFALRALELVQPHVKKEIEPGFVKILARAKSNVPEMGTGAEIFEKFVKKAKGQKTVESVNR